MDSHPRSWEWKLPTQEALCSQTTRSLRPLSSYHRATEAAQAPGLRQPFLRSTQRLTAPPVLAQCTWTLNWLTGPRWHPPQHTKSGAVGRNPTALQSLLHQPMGLKQVKIGRYIRDGLTCLLITWAGFLTHRMGQAKQCGTRMVKPSSSRCNSHHSMST